MKGVDRMYTNFKIQKSLMVENLDMESLTDKTSKDELKQFLIHNHFEFNPLMVAVAKGYVESIDLLLINKTIDINYKDNDSGVNAFWLACLYG